MNEDHGHNTCGEERGTARDLLSAQKGRSVIVFGLICQGGHEFEGWFRSNRDFNEQSANGIVACPACHTTRVEKAIMAANLEVVSQPVLDRPYGDDTDLTDNTDTIAELEAEIFSMRRQIKEELRAYVETSPDHTGTEFPEYEDFEDMVSLIDEGLGIDPLPVGPGGRRKKLN
jgi:hypothetical protein